MNRKTYIILALVILIILIGVMAYMRTRKPKVEKPSIKFTIIDAYNKILGRNPANRSVDATAKEVAETSANKEGFTIRFERTKKRPVIERLTSVVDPTKTIEFQAWKDWLANGDVTTAQFKKILHDSAERKSIVEKQIQKVYSANMYGATMPADEITKMFIYINPTLDFEDSSTAISDQITTAFNTVKPRSYIGVQTAVPLYNDVVRYYTMSPAQIKNFIATLQSFPDIDVSSAVDLNTLLLKISPRYAFWFKVKEDKAVYNNASKDDTDTIIRKMIKRSPNGPWTPDGIPEYTTLKFRIMMLAALYRSPTAGEIVAIQNPSFTAALIKDSTGFIDSWIRNNTEYANVDAAIKKEVALTYTNVIFAPAPPATVTDLYNQIKSRKFTRDDLRNIIMSLPEYKNRDDNLKQMIVATYSAQFGRNPTNTEIAQFSTAVSKDKTIDANTIFTKYFKLYHIRAAAQDAKNKRMIIFREGGVELRELTTFDLKGTLSYPNFNPALTENFGMSIIEATTNPTNSSELFVLCTDSVYTFDLTNIKSPPTISTSAGKPQMIYTMLDGISVDPNKIAGIIPHYTRPERKNEYMVFLTSGDYLVWDVVKHSSRYRLPIATSQSSFPKFGLTLDDVETVCYYNKNADKMMFIQSSTNNPYLWDPVNGKSVTTKNSDVLD